MYKKKIKIERVKKSRKPLKYFCFLTFLSSFICWLILVFLSNYDQDVLFANITLKIQNSW